MFLVQLTQLIFLKDVPGFHYDEGWAATFAHRIATEPGFWPIQAMSPYTSAWSHYVAAFIFKCFGTSLSKYRLSGYVLVFLGISCLSYSVREKFKHLDLSLAGTVLPWIIAFFPALVVNHRFTLEITTFHVFCLGGLGWALSTKGFYRNLWIALFLFLGISSHILFITPALGLFVTDLFLAVKPRTELKERTPFIVLLVALSGFFIKIALSIPEHDKSLGLLVLCGVCLGSFLWPEFYFNQTQRLKAGFARLPKKFRLGLTCLLLAPSVGLLIFFTEGSWSEVFFSSQIQPILLVWPLLPAIATLYWGRSVFKDPLLRAPLLWFTLSTVLTLLIATKPAPRYFEVSLLMSAVLLSFAWARCPRPLQILSLSTWCILGTLQLYGNYFAPILEHQVRRDAFHFLFFRDSSDDTLPKQEIAQTLGQLGCNLSDIESADIRLMEPLRFLALGDWPLAHSQCKLGPSKIGIRPTRVGELGESYTFEARLR